MIDSTPEDLSEKFKFRYLKIF